MTHNPSHVVMEYFWRQVLGLFELFSNCVKSPHWIWSWWLLMVFGDKSFVFQAGNCELFLLLLISCIDITFKERVSLSAWTVIGVCTVWKRATDGSENASQLMWSCTQTPAVNTAHALWHKSVTTSETPGSCSWFWEEAPDLPRATVTVICWKLFQVALCHNLSQPPKLSAAALRGSTTYAKRCADKSSNLRYADAGL